MDELVKAIARAIYPQYDLSEDKLGHLPKQLHINRKQCANHDTIEVLRAIDAAGWAVVPKERIDWITKACTDYLASGGLFNPELANHEAVRDMIRLIRDALTAAPKMEETK